MSWTSYKNLSYHKKLLVVFFTLTWLLCMKNFCYPYFTKIILLLLQKNVKQYQICYETASKCVSNHWSWTSLCLSLTLTWQQLNTPLPTSRPQFCPYNQFAREDPLSIWSLFSCWGQQQFRAHRHCRPKRKLIFAFQTIKAGEERGFQGVRHARLLLSQSTNILPKFSW